MKNSETSERTDGGARREAPLHTAPPSRKRPDGVGTADLPRLLCWGTPGRHIGRPLPPLRTIGQPNAQIIDSIADQ